MQISKSHNTISFNGNSNKNTYSTQNQMLQSTYSQKSQKMQVMIIGKNSDPELEFIIQQSDMWINNDIDQNESFQNFNDCIEIEIVTLHQTHFDYIVKELKRKSTEILHHSKNAPIILINSTRYVSHLVELISIFILELGLPKEMFVRSVPYTFNQQNDYLLQLTQMTHSKLLQYFNFSETYTYVFFDIKLKNGNLEFKKKQEQTSNLKINSLETQKVNQFRLIIQLNSRAMPKTCFNFYQLCQGNFKNSKGQRLSYKNTIFHAFQKNSFIQGGAFIEHEKDESVYGHSFEDENYSIKHDQPGIIGMANQGIPHTNASQFYITLSSQPDKDHKYLAFGLVVYGMKYLRQLNKLTEKSSFTPLYETRIVNCGEYNFQKDDFINETKKDFDLLDNIDVINTQLQSQKKQRLESSLSTSRTIQSIIDNGDFNKLQIKKDKDLMTSSKEKFKQSFSKEKELSMIYQPKAQNKPSMFNNTFHSPKKENKQAIELIKQQDKQIFKQYKKDQEEQVIFQFQNINLLTDRGGTSKNLQKQIDQAFSNKYATIGNAQIKLQINNNRDISQQSENNDVTNELSNNQNKKEKIQLHNQSPQKLSTFGTLNDQNLFKILHLQNTPGGKSTNGQHMNQHQSYNLLKTLNQTMKNGTQSKSSKTHEKDFIVNGFNFGSRQGTNNTKFASPNLTLLEYLNINFSGQGLQFRKVPKMEKNTQNSITMNTKNQILERQGSIDMIRNEIKNQNNITTLNQFPALNEVPEMTQNQEEIGSLIMISQISQFKKFIVIQYNKKLEEEQLIELNKIIPELSESIAMQLPISLKKSLSSTQEQIFLNKLLTQDIQIPNNDTRNTLFFMSKQAGFDISEVFDDW